jgi:hypothetical protein
VFTSCVLAADEGLPGPRTALVVGIGFLLFGVWGVVSRPASSGESATPFEQASDRRARLDRFVTFPMLAVFGACSIVIAIATW